jgi:tripartite-type tricarboxylate transporter receptor subunit TctC
MKKIVCAALVFSAAGILFAAGGREKAAPATDWPSGPVQLVVPSKPGGGTDIQARIFANYLQGKIGKPVVVLDQDSGGGTVAYETVRTAKPDGLTLLFFHTSIIVNYHTGRYDHPISDFTTIANMQSYPPQVYAVSSKAKWNNMKEFVEDARKNPGKYVFGVALGGTSHFIAGQIMMSENVDLKLVEASAEVDKVAAIQGGHIDMGNLGASAARQYIQAGKMKVLALIDPGRDPAFPEFIPAVEQGVNTSWQAPLILWGPPNMDQAIVEKINAACKDMEKDPTALDQLVKLSSRYKYMNVEDSQKFVQSEDEKIGALAKKLGLAKK